MKHQCTDHQEQAEEGGEGAQALIVTESP